MSNLNDKEVASMAGDPLRILTGDCREVLKTLPEQSINCCVTSPPYFGLRDYHVDGQIGLETTPDEYIADLVKVFRAVHRVLRDDGTLWVVIGDSYANDGKWGGHTGGKHAKALHDTPVGRNKRHTGLKPKDLIGIPWMMAFALRTDGWWLRQDIVWSKPAPMPESVLDRCTRAHEYIFMFSKNARYYYDQEAIKEPGIYTSAMTMSVRAARDRIASSAMPVNGTRVQSDKQRGHGRPHVGFNDRWDHMSKQEQCNGMRNKRSVWQVATHAYPGSHWATFPPDLIKPCILAGCPSGGVVLDPFAGSGTTAKVALEAGRKAVMIELNPDYIALIEQRTRTTMGLPY